ncbi:hypothetical protein FO519_009373, partial [Halicephalobus sp. NKZ332]
MAKTFDYLTLDPGTEYLRFAYVDDHGHPEPIIVTNNGGDRQFSTMIAMKRPPLFQKKAYFSDVRLIVADAFRAEQKYVDGISFYAKRKNDSYEIPSIGKQVGNDMRGHEQVEVMQMILKNTSSMINDQLKNKRIYICVPDACSISHRRKLRKALELVSESYQEGRNKKVEANSIVFIQQSAAVAQMAFHWIGRNVSVTNGSGLEIPPRRIIVAISFGAGHFSAGAYEQRSYERCGIVRLCGSGDNQLGGEDLNLKLGEWCMNHKDIQPYAEELKKNKRLLKFYRKTMETVKTDLSELEQTLADIEVEENNVKSVEISRKNFEKACEEIFERIKKHLYNISDYLKENELHCTHVIYAGGSTRVIQFRKIVKELFEKPQIIESINPDECQVLGTGLKAGIKDGIHGLAYAECRDTAMDDHYIEIMRTTGKKVKLYLTKKGESVQNLPERWIKTIDGSEGVPYPGDDNKNLEKKAKELKWIPDVESDVRLMIQDYPKDACDRKVTDNEEKVNAIVPTGPQGDANSHFDTQINTQDYPIKGILQQGLHQGSHQPYQEKNDLETQYQVNHSSNPTYSLHQSENNVLGIDLGTTKIVCATCKIGDFKPEILTFNNGSRTLSSFVEFDKYRNCTSYGDQALSNLERNPGYILYEEFGERQRLKITQEKFKEWTMGLTDTITHICQRALKNIRMSSFDKVLFIGGASRMKIIKDLVREIIPCQVHDEQDEVIAIGAAIRAAQLKDPAHKNEKHFIEILPIGVGIGLAKNQYSIMVNRGTHFPTKIEKQYSTSINNQEVVHIAVYEGERLLADRNRKLGEVYLKGLPRGPAREVHIDVTFEFDQNGILTVHAKSKNGREMRFTIDYKALRKEGEPIEDLLRQIQSYRIDSDGQQIIDNAKHKLLENIEYIRHRI